MDQLTSTATVLLGATGTVRDLVGAGLSLQGVPVTMAAAGDDALAAAAQADSVVVLVSPGPEAWDTARRAGRPVVLVHLSRSRPSPCLFSGNSDLP